jgi:hypothetical protein
VWSVGFSEERVWSSSVEKPEWRGREGREKKKKKEGGGKKDGGTVEGQLARPF